MCIFSGPVYDVSDTKIYCSIKEDKQTLVYSMDAGFHTPVAMILPIPANSKKEDAVEFVNLKDHANFFKELDEPFVIHSRGMAKSFGCASPSTLKVHEVGDYIASFVPHRLFFNRLDESFRLNENVWDAMPQYKNFGFVVFQLSKNSNDINHYHPMGFKFPTKLESLFFPTVHVHEGQIPTKEDFDHALYFQADDRSIYKAQKSHSVAKDFIKSELVDPDKHVYKVRLYGQMENKDTYIN